MRWHSLGAGLKKRRRIAFFRKAATAGMGPDTGNPNSRSRCVPLKWRRTDSTDSLSMLTVQLPGANSGFNPLRILAS